MDPALWDYIKAVINWLIAPVLGFFIWNYKKQTDKIDELERRIVRVETNEEVVKVKLDYISKNIEKLNSNIEELIKRNG